MRAAGVERGFPATALIAYTPYVAGAALALTLLLLLAGRRPQALVAGLSALVLAVVVAGRAVPDDRAATVGEEPRMRILTANVRYGATPAPAIGRMVRRHRVDLLSLQELTPELAAALRRGEAGERLPHAVMTARRGASGTGLMSRRPLERRPEPAGLFNAIAVARTAWPGFGRFEIIAAHPPPPTPQHAESWAPDLRALPRAGEGGTPRVLAGDFNATLDHTELRALLESGYRDAAASAGEGLTGTWPSRRPLPRVAIDHILIPRDWRVVSVEVLHLPRSDHRAVLAELAPPA